MAQTFSASALFDNPKFDSPQSVQRYFGELLRAAGYEVMIVDDIEEALSLCDLFDRATEGCASERASSGVDRPPTDFDTSL